MSERLAKILESKDVHINIDNLTINSGCGTLPSICPNCGSQLDFGRRIEEELICRDKCGFVILYQE